MSTDTMCGWQLLFRFTNWSGKNPELKILRQWAGPHSVITIRWQRRTEQTGGPRNWDLRSPGTIFTSWDYTRLLARSQYSEGPATGHLDTGFSWFPCVYKRILRGFPRFQVATTCLSCSPPGLKIGRWHCGRKGSWGCLRTWCWGEYLDLGGTR